MHFNSDFQKNSNISNIFKAIWNNPQTSRIDISKKFNIYRSTVSNIIGTLLSNDVIIEKTVDLEKSGRKPICLSINKDFGMILGIELQTNDYKVVLISFDGTKVFSKYEKIKLNAFFSENPEENFINILDDIIKGVDGEIQKANIPLLGIVVGMPGIINIDKGIIVNSVPFQLKDFDYAKVLKNKYKVPLFIENDAKCCAWLQCGMKREESESGDFLCIFTKDYSDSVDITKDGIGIGVAISMNGQVIHGHNYAIGEYVSGSWRPKKVGQTGLADAVKKTVFTNDESYKDWIIDLFSTVTTFIPLFEPSTVFFHGQTEDKHNLILQTIEEEVPQFNAIMKNCNSKLVIVSQNQFEIAYGAALMFLQTLSRIENLEQQISYTSISWDEIFELQKNQLEKKQLANK